jgi:uncharacterized protein (TIGR03083 family)
LNVSIRGVNATGLLVHDTLDVVRSLSTAEWASPSACAGWRVQDILVHLATFCNLIADPAFPLPNNPSGTSERLNDALVDERRDWSPVRALDYYEAQSTAALATLTALQGAEYADATTELADLGTYHLAELSNAVAFDHLVHLSCDVLTPQGPIEREQVPMDESRVGPALDWMFAGLPQMCADSLRQPLSRPLGIRVTGPGGRDIVLSWTSNGDQLMAEESSRLPDDCADSSAEDFLRWATKRTDWRTVSTITGDQDYVPSVLDAINII